MARTKLQELQRRYRKQLKAAKNLYKARTGKKVARGFKETEEYKRITRNRDQALYRYERRKIDERAESAVNRTKKEIGDESKVISDRQFSGRAPGIGNFTGDLIVANELFFTALDSGEGVLSSVFDLQEAQAADETAYGVVVDYEGKRKVYTDPFQFERAILDLLKEAEKLQNKAVKKGGKTVKNRDRNGDGGTIEYPTVSYAIVEDSKGRQYMTVTGSFDEANFEQAALNQIELN